MNYAEGVVSKRLELAAVQKQVQAESRYVIELDAACDVCDVAHEIIQKSAQLTQQEVHSQIASVVSRCLELVFDDPYEFVIKFNRKRGQTEAELVFVRDGVEIDPMTASGGGVVDVAAFALRLVSISMNYFGKRRVLVMDEPFKFLSREFHVRAREMLELLSEELGVQIIMVTHIAELKTGKVVTL